MFESELESIRAFSEAWKSYYNLTSSVFVSFNKIIPNVRTLPRYIEFLLTSAKESDFFITLELQDKLDNGVLRNSLGPPFTWKTKEEAKKELSEIVRNADKQKDDEITEEAKRFDNELRGVIEKMDAYWPSVRKTLKRLEHYHEDEKRGFLIVTRGRYEGIIPLTETHGNPRLAGIFSIQTKPGNTVNNTERISDYLQCYVVSRSPLAGSPTTILKQQYEDMEILLEEAKKKLGTFRAGEERKKDRSYHWELKDGNVYCEGKGPVKLPPKLEELFNYFFSRRNRRISIEKIVKDLNITVAYKRALKDRINKLISALDSEHKILGLEKGEVRNCFKKEKKGKELITVIFYAV